MSLNIPFPAANPYFVSGLELFGRLLPIVRLKSRLIGLLFVFAMLVAYWTSGPHALGSVFSDPGTFYSAAPYTFLFSSLLVLIFGAGPFSPDALLVKRLKKLTKDS